MRKRNTKENNGQLLESIHKEVLPLVEVTNGMMRKGFEGTVAVFQKGGIQLSTDVLTETDLEVDKFLREKLKKKFPAFGFVTEEGETIVVSEGEFVWVIDSVDGTANFANKIPIFGTSVALWGENGPVYGIMSFPMLDEVVHAVKNKGAYLNGKPLVRQRPLSKNLPSFVYAHVGSDEEKLATLKKLLGVVAFTHGQYGSAAYHLAMVALGQVDCAISVNLPLWDIAAGLIIAEEAGLHNAFVSPFPSVLDVSKEYKHTLVTAEKKLALKVAGSIRS